MQQPDQVLALSPAEQQLAELQKKLAELKTPSEPADAAGGIGPIEAIVGVLLVVVFLGGVFVYVKRSHQHRHEKLKVVVDDDDDYSDDQDRSEDDRDMESAPNVQYAGGDDDEQEDYEDEEDPPEDQEEVRGGRQQPLQEDVEDELRKKQEDADRKWKQRYSGME